MSTPIHCEASFVDPETNITHDITIEVSYSGPNESLLTAIQQLREADFVQLTKEVENYDTHYNELRAGTIIQDVVGADGQTEFLTIHVLLEEDDTNLTSRWKAFHALQLTCSNEFSRLAKEELGL